MEFRVLGRLEVMSGETRLALRGQQQQLVLALLLADSGASVSTDTLIDEIWGDAPPATARKAIQSNVAQLRSALNADTEMLAGGDGGYLVDPGPVGLDSVVFEREVSAARVELDRDPAVAAERLGRALGLWRGGAYAGLVDISPRLRVEAARLEELKLAALETRLRADLAIGDAALVLGELEMLVSEHPVRERFRALLMVALYRCGRQSDALAAYQATRLVLAEEIGIEPSAELRGLEQRILEQDPSLDTADPLTVARSPQTQRRNPYKGLRAFEESDASDFFGRRDLIDRVTGRLRRRDVSGRFVALVGPSGSGKSSVVRAGVVSALRSGAIDTLSDVAVVTMFPGQDPMAALEAALTAESMVGPLAEQAVVLIVDQFEELFTLADRAGRDAFFDTLAEAVSRPSGAVRVIVTIRADFLGHALLHTELARLLDEGLELVPPLADHEVTAAIIEPARRVAMTVEPALVAEMVRDVGSRPATLPLLQYVLTDLFERSSGEVMGLADYQASGAILGALTRRADDLYGSMDEVEQEATRQVYLRLVTIGDEAQHLRRRVARSELFELSLRSEAVERVLHRYGEQRLLTFDREHTTGEATVEVPHESLLREWPRLRDWIETNRAALISRRRLASAATEWEAADRDSSYTARGPLLAEYENLASGSTVSLTDTEHDYVRASQATVDAEMRAKSRRRRILLGVLATATAVSVLLAGIAFYQRGQADEQTRLADEQARLATARELAAAAVANLDADPERSILLALEAIDATRAVDGTVLPEAEGALHQAVRASRLVYTLDGGRGVAFSPDGGLLATTTGEGTVRLLVANTGELVRELIASVRPLDGAQRLIDLTFSGDGSRLSATSGVSVSFLKYPTMTWDVATGEEVSVVLGHGDEVVSSALSPDGSLLATSSVDTTVRLWQVATGDEIGVLDHDDQTLDVSFSPDGSRVAVAAGALIHVWDVSSQTEQFELVGHDATVMSVGFLPDGDHLVSASLDHTARIWDLDERVTVSVLRHPSAVRVVTSDSSGTVLATGAQDGIVRLWDASTGEQTITLAGHNTAVNSLSFSIDGTLLVSGAGVDSIDLGADRRVVAVSGVTRVWFVGKSTSREPIAVPALAAASSAAEDVPAELVGLFELNDSGGSAPLSGPARIGDVAISPDGAQMAVSGAPGVVTLWDTGSGHEVATLVGHVLPVTGIAYSPTRDQLATVAPDGVRTWSVATGAPLRTLVENDTSLRARSGWYVDVEFNPDGERVAVSRQDRTLTIFDASTGAEIDLLRQVSVPNDIEFSPDGETIANGTDDFAAMLMDLSGGTTVLVHDARVDNLAYSPDGTRLATVSPDGRATMWDLTSNAIGGTAIYSISAERLAFRAVAFSPTGETFATAGEDGTVRIWDAADGSPRLTLQAHDGAVIELSYGPDGTRLASISVDGTARLHILDINEMIELARSRLTRSFTEAECRQYLHQDSCGPA